MRQEYKVVDLVKGSEWFFFADSFKSAYQHAKVFLTRNAGSSKYQLYRVNDGVGARWLPVHY